MLVKLILTLLALLTGFAGGDVARHAPATPTALAAGLTMAAAVVEARSARAAHRPAATVPQRVLTGCLKAVRAATAAPFHPGFAPRGLRARE